MTHCSYDLTRVVPQSDGSLRCGPMIFERDQDNGGCEFWRVRMPGDLGIPRLSLKNYGGKPKDAWPFTGWRLVAGGPFTEAGGWTSRNDAILGATPWLIGFYRAEALRRMTELEREVEAIRGFFNGLT